MPSLNDNRCIQCGQRQDEDPGAPGSHAPMVHFGSINKADAKHVGSYHLDCLPYEYEQQLRDKHGSRIDAAKDGVRGDALRAIPDDITDDVFDSTKAAMSPRDQATWEAELAREQSNNGGGK